MKILLIAYEFTPQDTVASVRPTKLYKFWKELGHEVTVVTTLKKENSIQRKSPLSESGGGKIVEIDCKVWFEKPYEWLRLRIARRNSDSVSSDTVVKSAKPTLIQSLKQIISYYYRSKMFSVWVKLAKKFLRRNEEKYDIIFSTFGPKPCVMIGKFAKKINPKAIWIADFRDPPKDTRQQIKIRNPQNFTRKYCHTADLITAVSKGCLEELHLPNGTSCAVITNGYDWEDRCFDKKIVSDNFTFVVTGNVYCDDSYEPLFKACAELIEEGVINSRQLKFQAAGWNLSRFALQADKYGLLDHVELLGRISRNAALTLQSSANILLVETWNTKERQGVIGGKIFEYMTSNIPVAVMVNGNQKGSAIAELINDCGLGFCYEFAAPDFDALKSFISDIYHLWKTNEKYEGQNWETIKHYNYKHIAEELINQALRKVE